MSKACCRARVGLASLAFTLFIAQVAGTQNASRSVLLEVLRNSWDVERNETLVYVRVFSDGFAEAHPMRNVDFRNIQFKTMQLSNAELTTLKSLLSDAATSGLESAYSRYWGNKDFGYRYSVKISGPTHKQIELVNFQPFLARKNGRPYPKQLEKLGCSIWRLRAQVSSEPLEKNWVDGCAGLGY